MDISVVIPTHNPHAGRLRRTLAGLRAQSLPATQWSALVVDNASLPALDPAALAPELPTNAHIIREPQLGLASARRRGFAEARGDIIVLVDDDNVLAPDYLAQVATLFAAHPRLGGLGGRSVPEFEQAPPAWVREFDDLLACRDLGATPLISSGLRHPATGRNTYPAFAPIGAGLALRRATAQAWLEHPPARHLTDRRGDELTSGGDNDIVFRAMQSGWEVGYFPALSLTHLIPAGRTSRDYLARLNRGIQKSWMQVLALHDANPFPPLSAGSAALRQLKAWFSYRAWSSPAAYVRWQGACGHFEGRASQPRPSPT